MVAAGASDPQAAAQSRYASWWAANRGPLPTPTFLPPSVGAVRGNVSPTLSGSSPEALVAPVAQNTDPWFASVGDPWQQSGVRQTALVASRPAPASSAPPVVAPVSTVAP
eukprot:9317712-Alexandrium_andersonii.AAC.1